VSPVTHRRDAIRVIRLACLAFLPLAACAGVPVERPTHDAGYSGTVQKVLRVVRQGAGVPGMKLLGKWESVLVPALRQNSETLQYVVQSDREFSVGDCVQVIPGPKAFGPAFRYGEAEVVSSESCSG
jgi:hypothetical protein